ncbi:MAG: sodium:proton antiporter NhaD [Paraprevotella sp.]|nr:sodium:proton antiporter NhaD [Paraprevotella sp.]
MTIVIVTVLILGYCAIATEHITNINKAAVAMFLGVICWTLYMVAGKQYVEMRYAEEYATFLAGNSSSITSLKNFMANYVFIGHVADICQIVLYLLATMSIVDLLNSNGCFDFISEWMRTRNSKRLLWMTALVTYVLSANLDNLTTALMMFAIMRQLLPNSHFRMYYGAVIVIAANAGGCLTVIGDVSTLMLWVKGAVTPSSFSGAMFLPSIVAVMIPTYLISLKLPEQIDINTPRIRFRGDDTTLTRWQRVLMLFVGIGGLWFIPTFHNLTKLPPFVGALCVLALFGVVNELCNRKLIKSDQPFFRPTPRFMQTESIQTILFFIGVSMAISALQETGALYTAALWCDRYIHNIYVSSLILGGISAFLDNVALVLTSISMYDVVNVTVDAIPGVDPAYVHSFALNGPYWQLVAYSGGLGGCILSIGSTAGYALMKAENISIWWYLRHISGKVLIGWLAGLGVYFLVDSFVR